MAQQNDTTHDRNDSVYRVVAQCSSVAAACTAVLSRRDLQIARAPDCSQSLASAGCRAAILVTDSTLSKVEYAVEYCTTEDKTENPACISEIVWVHAGQ